MYKVAITASLAERHIAFALGYFANDPAMTVTEFAMFRRRGALSCAETQHRCLSEHAWTLSDVQNNTDAWSAYTACVAENPDCKRLISCYE
jgi:hypothetical protein